MKKVLSILSCVVLLFVPAKSQSKIVPIIEMKSLALLGGVEKGRWLDAKTTVKNLAGENLYKTYQLSSGQASPVKYPKPGTGEPCDDFYSVDSVMSDEFGVALGEGATWNPVPRAPKAIDLNDAAYKKVVADVLRSKGIVSRNVKLKQAFRVDLEGDGREEVLLEASSYAGTATPSAKKGDYSFILLRKIVGGKVRNIFLTGEVVMKNIEFGAPGTYQLSAVADLNGDGRMEIVVFGSYYEGIWVETYEMKGDKPVAVKALDAGCGV